jgi:hypothetical protein
MKNKKKILLSVLFISIFFALSIRCGAQDFTPNKTNTVQSGGVGDFTPTDANTVKKGTEAETKTPVGGVGDFTPTDANTVKKGTEAETSIPGGNISTPADKATDGANIGGTAGAGNSAANTQSVPNGGLVPCGLGGAADCTLCHLVLGFKNIYDYLLTLLLVATTLIVVVAGVMYMVSSGDKGMIDKAKSALTYALTAMILGLTAWLIINATLNALGYNKSGSWYNFTCDTAQTQGPTGGTGTGTLPGTGTGTGSGSYKASDNLSPKAQEVINNYINTQVGKNYGGDVHCYSTTEAAYTNSGLPGFGGQWKVWDGKETIYPGDAMQTNEHTWLVLENGATSNAIPNGKIGVNNDGLNYNINKAQSLGLQVRIIHLANVISK